MGNTHPGNPRGANRDARAGNGEGILHGISLYGNMEGATAKSLPRCKVVSGQSQDSPEEPLEIHGDMNPRYMVVVGSRKAVDTEFGLFATK